MATAPKSRPVIDRARELARVRDAIRARVPRGYEEVELKGMTVWQVPLARYSDTYNGHAMWLAALGAPKSYLTLHFLPAYMSPGITGTLEKGFRAAGKKLDMGKGCIRFQQADDLELGVIGDVLASMSVDRWVEIAESAKRVRKPAKKKAAGSKPKPKRT